jgi:hypothetical protein
MKRWRKRYLAASRRVAKLQGEQDAFRFIDPNNETARRIVDELEIEVMAEMAELARLRAVIEFEPKILKPVVWSDTEKAA